MIIRPEHIVEHIWLSEAPLWQLGHRGTFVLVAIMLISLCFTRWARVHLGRLWSGVITRKEGHKLIDTGPYAFVRHPNLYRAFIALFVTAAVEATAPALLGAALMSFGFWLKGPFEEPFLRIELGSGSYAAYYRRMPMIVPFITPGERASRRPRANQ